jgi:hypothetical protein
MLTFRSFITCEEFFNLLLLRFDTYSKDIKTLEDFNLFKKAKLMPIRYTLII